MTEEHKDQIARSIIGTIKLMIIALAIVLPVRYFLAQPFYVKGASMEPNFRNNEYLITEEISYIFNEPKRGDTIIFKYPENQSFNFIKRIIGLPGETISFENGKVLIYNQDNTSGIELEEPYLPEDTKTYTTEKRSFTISDDEYFVLGDNRYYSEDSRSFGPVRKDLIVGRVSVRGWPINKLNIFGSTEYNL